MKKAQILKNKQFKAVIKHIEDRVGPFSVGVLVSVLADSLDNLCQDEQNHSIRTMEITFNDFYSYKAKFEWEEKEG